MCLNRNYTQVEYGNVYNYIYSYFSEMVYQSTSGAHLQNN